MEFHPRYTFDLTHNLLGQPLPEQYHPHIVELHLPAPMALPIICPLDDNTLGLAQPFFRQDLVGLL